MPNISKYVSAFLTADDLKNGPRTIAIEGVSEDKVGTDRKLVMDASNLDGVRISLNKGNLEKLSIICGSEETDDWVGHNIVVYRDPNVMFGGKKVGGIAFRAATSDEVAAMRDASKT